MRSRARELLAGAALVLLGCDEHIGCQPVLQGEQNQLEFHDATLVVGAADRMHAVHSVVEGSRFCPSLACTDDVPGCVVDEDEDTRISEADVRACYMSSFAGPVTVEGTCVLADAPGELDWTLAPRSCPANMRGYQPGPERLRLPIVDAAMLAPWLQSTGDGFAVRELVADDGGEFPAALQLAPGSTAYVLADHTVHLAIVLAHPEADDAVAWTPPGWIVAASGDDGSASAIELDEWGVAALRLPAGAKLELTLHRDALALPLGRVEAVEAEAIHTIDIVVGYVGDDEAPDGHRAPIGARAVAHTSDNRVVYGLPVEWSITKGALPLWRDEELQWDPDFIALADREGRGCHPPADEVTTYHVDLVARWGDLEDTAEIRWTEPEVDESVLEQIAEWFKGGEDWDPAATCEGPGFPEQGCGCTTDNGAPALAPAFALLVLALRRRRLGRAPCVAGRRRRSCPAPVDPSIMRWPNSVRNRESDPLTQRF